MISAGRSGQRRIKNTSFLRSKRLILRPLQEKDINQRYLSWLNDREVIRHLESIVFPATMFYLRRFYNRISKSKSDIMFTIVDRKKHVHIGNIKLGNINWVHRYADLGIMIGDKQYWGKGYGTEACRLLLGYAFCGLELNKVFLGVSADHRFAIKAYKKAGFKIEGRLKKMIHYSGKYVDKILMGILREDFKAK